MKRSRLTALLAAPPLIFLALFYFYPLAEIFLLSFRPEGEWNFGGAARMFSSPSFYRVFWFTVWQAAVSTILTLALAAPGAYLFARFTFPGKKAIESLIIIPFVLPTVVTAAAFQALLGQDGLVNRFLTDIMGLASPPVRIDQTVWFILLAHVFYNFAVVHRIVSGFWAHLEPNLGDAARMLGASPRRVFLKITLPLLRPALAASSLLVFIFCFTSFGVILILGGPRFATLETAIYTQAVHLFNLPAAGALSLVQIVFTFTLMWGYTWVQKKTGLALNPGSAHKNQRPLSTTREKLFAGVNLGFMAVLLIAPIASLVLRSLISEEGFTLAYYQALFQDSSTSISFVPPFRAVLNSLGFAGATMVLAVTLGLMAAVFLARSGGRVSSLLDPIFMLPLSTSAVTLGFGFIIALDEPPLNLRTSLALVPLAHTLAALPFVVRSILPALRSLPPSLREAAALLGASPWRAWRFVDLPIIGRALLVGAVFAFSVSLGEFGATVFLARPGTPTLPVAIYRFLGQPGALHYGQAMAMSSLLMLVTAGGFLMLERFKVGRVGEF
ncbi:MAG: iron ABC transporter permease [Pseudomonadota bacterium]